MKHILFCAAFALIAFSANAQTAAPGAKQVVSAQAIRQLDSLYHYLDTSGLYNGNILVASGGRKVLFGAIGFANLTTKEKLTEASTFELASVSKQFTAFGVLRLAAAGKLKLDQKLETLFPTFPYKDITIRHLLNHTCGLPDYMELMIDHWDKKKIATNNDVIAILTQYHPDREFAPGTKWAYSNTGYAMLASVIEKVSGKSYAAYMQSEVFTPLQLTHTSIYMRRFAPRTIPGYAYGYVKDSDNVYRLPDNTNSNNFVVYMDGIGGDGSVNTTAGDLLRWDNAVRDQKLLPAALWKEALTPPTIDGKSTSYGFGLEVINTPATGRVLKHNGGWPGYITRNVLYLDKDIALIELSNMEQTQSVVEGTWNAVRDITMGRPFTFPMPLVQHEVRIDTQVYRSYLGTYITTEMPGFELNFFMKEGKLMTQATGQGAFEIKPESKTLFFMEGMPIQVEFMPETDGSVKRLMLHQNGDHEFKRKS